MKRYIHPDQEEGEHPGGGLPRECGAMPRGGGREESDSGYDYRKRKLGVREEEMSSGSFGDASIDDFVVDREAEFPTHDVLQLAINPRAAAATVGKQRKIGMLSDMWANQVEKKLGEHEAAKQVGQRAVGKLNTSSTNTKSMRMC